jgi:16S rRNA (cytosine967-C5)-methyltransferase
VASGTERRLAPWRSCAFAVVRRVFEHGAYADRAFQAEAAGLDPRDRALAMTAAYGTVQRRATLDHIAAELVSRPLAKLDPAVLAAIRLGLFQVLFLDGVADHAAVNESVELAKSASRGGAQLVNAVLRRALREGSALLAELDDGDPAAAAILHSVPHWLASMWWEQLGAERARSLLRRVNEPAESALRVNTLVSEREAVLEELPVAAHPAPLLAEGLVLDAPFDAHGSELFRRGAITPQSRGSMLVARIVEPGAGERVLDLCAAPGGKTTHLAALMGGRGEIVAVEHHRGRAAALQRTCERMRAGNVRVEVDDAARPRGAPPFDRVLVDPPCSGLGTLQSRPDLRWRATPSAINELAALQRRILAAAGAATAPGGTLVYSVCTISAAEGEGVVGRFESEHPEFVVDDLQASYPEWAHPRYPSYLQLLPDRDGTDGFFVARLRRAPVAGRPG